MKEANNIEEVTNVVNQLNRIVIEYKEVTPDDIFEIVNKLEDATTMNFVSELSNELEKVVEEFEASLTLPCIEAGVIVINE